MLVCNTFSSILTRAARQLYGPAKNVAGSSRKRETFWAGTVSSDFVYRHLNSFTLNRFRYVRLAKILK